MQPIELLAPARDYVCGTAAIDHGADAVYIGGPAFGARSAAGNAMADIERLVNYAHRFWAKVYLTLNTILYDDELESARALAREAWNAGVDALIIQDMGLLQLDLPPLPLIASTQMNNMEADHIRFLQEVGFRRVILARELNLAQIREIRRETTIELEAFVHGALCVGLSGRCYLSAALGGRSANRGACGQPCRLPWTLIDGDEEVLQRDRHLLSLKDMDRSAYLADLIAAGVSAFKIEGRLKDSAYVKNITAYYREKLDALIDGRTDLKRASSGRTTVSFAPDPRKTFHRGATAYFLKSDDDDIWSPDTPKSIGEELGVVRRCGSNWFTLDAGTEEIHAGDGLCFFDWERELHGLQVVKGVDGRVQVHATLAGLEPGMRVLRNRDHVFLKQLEGPTAARTVGLTLWFREIPSGFELCGVDEDGVTATVRLIAGKAAAAQPAAALETIRKQLSKLGGSLFHLDALHMETGAYFLRTAELNQLRRDLIEALEKQRWLTYPRMERGPAPDPLALYPFSELDYCFNVSNAAAREFYRNHGVTAIDDAFELRNNQGDDVVMTTRHCLRRCLDACPRREMKAKLKEPLSIEHAGRRFLLEFDCRMCRMKVKRGALESGRPEEVFRPGKNVAKPGK